jgi:hypothetical protein
VDLDVVPQQGGGVVKGVLGFAELSAQVLRQASLVERAPQVGYLRPRHGVGDVVNSRPGDREALLDTLGRHVDDLHQLDRTSAAEAEGRVVNEVRRLSA